jgi:chromosome segregation ATPase
MMMRRAIFLMLLIGIGFSGCGSDHSEEVAALQKQVAALTRQVEDLRRQTDAAQEGQQKLRELVGTLEVEVTRFKGREASQPASAASSGKGLNTPTTSASLPTREGTAKASCPQVWKLLGQGADEATVARTLGTSEAAVQACEQEIGRGKGRR